MARTDPQIKLRLPESLKARLEEHAKRAGRSLNAEVVARLEESFPITTISTDDPMAPLLRVEEMAKELYELSQFVRESQDAIREEIARREALDKAAAGRKR